MEVLIILAPFTILLALSFLLMFIYSNQEGQFEDTDQEKFKILFEEIRVETDHQDNNTLKK